MYELTKILGPLDLTGLEVPDELRAEFLQRGHITLDDKGDDYDPSDIVGGPIAFIGDAYHTACELYVKLFDGPDKNLMKAHRIAQVIKQGVQRYQFKAILGKTADGVMLKLRVALVTSSDQRNAVKVIPTLNLDAVVSSGKQVSRSS